MSEMIGHDTPYRESADVHYCEPGNGHRLHHIIRMGRVAGWYVLVKIEGGGCARLSTMGPFPNREEAAMAAFDATR